MRDEGAEQFGNNVIFSPHLLVLVTSAQSLALQVVFGRTGMSSISEHYLDFRLTLSTQASAHFENHTYKKYAFKKYTYKNTR